MGDGDPELDPVGIEFAEGRTGGPDVTNGGDWVVGPAVHIVGKFDACVRSVDGFNRVALGGYYEGGAGTALIEWHTPRLFVTPYAWAVHSQNETGTHGIYVNGGHDHLIAPCYVGNNGGDGIHLTNEVGTFKLWPYTRVRSNGGEGIYVDVEGRWDGADDPVCIVPHEEGFQDSVTYTDATDANVLYPNGRRRVASGTVTVPAGGEIALDTVVPFGTTPHVEWTVAADPGGPVKVTQSRQRSEGVDGQRLWFEEHRGETSVQVEYRVELRDVARTQA
jgi:hypothetical protein